LSKSVSQLISFVEKGGTVDYVAQQDAAEGTPPAIVDERAALLQAFSEIRSLEEKVWLLEHKQAPAATA
jgi:hypothetical protein